MESRQTTFDDLREGQRLRDLGISQAEEHDYDGWLPLARAVARRLNASRSMVNADDVIRVIGFPAGHRNIIGSIFATGEWVKIGYTTSTRKERHAGVIGIWRLR